jgi:hypothetical protein
MSVLNKLASALNQRDEVPNQILAEEIASSDDEEAVAELITALTHRDKAIRYDCIKVLYEIGAQKPELIAPYADDFAKLITSRDNRLVWGGMTALGSVVDQAADAVGKHVDAIINATAHGSVITQDWGVRVLAMLVASQAALASKNVRYAERVWPFLLDFLRHCPSKDLPRHAESVLMAVNADNAADLASLLEGRQGELTPAQAKRLEAVLKKLHQAG